MTQIFEALARPRELESSTPGRPPLTAQCRTACCAVATHTDMDKYAKEVLSDLVEACTEGSLVFQHTNGKEKYCSLIVADSAGSSVCQWADPETIMVNESGRYERRHKCLAELLLTIERAEHEPEAALAD